LIKRLRIVVPLLLLVGAAAWFLVGHRAPVESGIAGSGTVEATAADLGVPMGGRVAEVDVREGDRVSAGQVLARLETLEIEARLAQAEAQVAAARARLLELERGSRPEERAQAQAAVAAARTRRDDAERALVRTRTLLEGGAVSQEQLDQAEAGLAIAVAQHDQAVEQLQLVTRGARVEQLAAQEAQVRLAEATVMQVRAALESALVRAPFAGIVTLRHRQPGEIVAAGSPIVTVMDPHSRWVRIYVRGDEIGRVSLDQPAVILSDSHPDSVFHGRVNFVAAQAEFTPRNVQTAAERVKLVYAVKVAIEGDPGLALKPGVAADVRLEIHP
jgi:HlyD family secretion protein